MIIGSMTHDLIIQGDVGGQRTLRPYWRNYYERTDAIVWVVDSSDRLRVGDCRDELMALLVEEVRFRLAKFLDLREDQQRLMGASLLVFANKQDIKGSMTSQQIEEVQLCLWSP
jgi:ADP-ribosylation factor-like protein 2